VYSRLAASHGLAKKPHGWLHHYVKNANSKAKLCSNSELTGDRFAEHEDSSLG